MKFVHDLGVYKTMPKKEHVHIVTDDLHKDLLQKLGEKHGSMTKAFESAVEHLDKLENIGTCSDCEIKIEAEESQKFSELSNLVSFSADNIREILRYFRGESTITEMLVATREKAFQFGKFFLNYLRIHPQNTYQNLLLLIEEWKKRTRLISSISVNKFESQLICRVNVFERNPIFVLMGLIGYLQSLELTFDVDLQQEDIFLTWMVPEKYAIEKTAIEQKINAFIEVANKELKPFILKRGYLPVMPHTMDWMADKLLQFETYPIEYSYRFITNLLEDNVLVEDSATQWAQFIQQTLQFLSYASDFKLKVNEEKKTFKISMITVTASLSKFLLQEAIIILAKYGWKLKSHKIDHKNLTLSFHYVGSDDKQILEPLYIINFGVFLNQRFQKLRMIPIDEYQDLTSSLFQTNPPRFREVFQKQGIKFANAIKLLANNDLLKMRAIGLNVIPQLIRITQRDPDQVSFIAEPSKFILIFKTVDPVEMESVTAIFIGVMKGFDYLDITPKIMENVVTIEFKRPSKIDVPTVEINPALIE